VERRCASCGEQALEAREIEDEFEYGPEGERITVVAHAVPVLVCAKCGETLYGPEAARVRHRAICAALHLLSPEEIKALRERLGPSQEGFAELTGIGVATLSRWERGRLLQTRALDRYLRLLGKTAENVTFLRELNRKAAPREVVPAPAAEPVPSSPWRCLQETVELRKRAEEFQRGLTMQREEQQVSGGGAA
jgi:putative zinc finger/helix-turn-helix YgiT family protein